MPWITGPKTASLWVTHHIRSFFPVPAVMIRNAYSDIVEANPTGGIVYGKTTGLYNKHHKYSELWNPWYPFRPTHGFQQAQLCCQHTKTLIHQRLKCALDNLKIESFQLADFWWNLLSELNSGLSDDSWIEYYSHIMRPLYNSDIFPMYTVHLTHLPF